MELVSSINDLSFKSKTAVTIGNFDGVHIGHKELINLTTKIANEKNLKSLVFTFENHPIEFLYNKKIERLTSPARKKEIIKELGIDEIVSVEFNYDIKNMTTEEFSQKILINALNASDVIMGFDSRLGNGKEGKVEYLYEVGKKMGFNVHIVDQVLVDNMRVSSSYIREMLKHGEVKRVKHFLGRDYEISGVVVHGKKIGRVLGFPTANIEQDYDVLLPQKGVYYCKVLVDGVYYDGATSVGDNPTVKDKGFSVETHLINFSGDIYGKSIKLFFLDRLRDEMKFSSLEDLKFQMNKDVLKIKNYIFT